MICGKCDNNMIWKADLKTVDYNFPSEIEGIISVWSCPKCNEITEILTVGEEKFIIGYDPVTGDKYLIV